MSNASPWLLGSLLRTQRLRAGSPGSVAHVGASSPPGVRGKRRPACCIIADAGARDGRPGAEVSDLHLNLNSLQQLFHSLDPSPFREKALDVEAEAYLVALAKELPGKDRCAWWSTGRNRCERAFPTSPPPSRRTSGWRKRASRGCGRFRRRIGWRALAAALAILGLALGAHHAPRGPRALGAGPRRRALHRRLGRPLAALRDPALRLVRDERGAERAAAPGGDAGHLPGVRLRIAGVQRGDGLSPLSGPASR